MDNTRINRLDEHLDLLSSDMIGHVKRYKTYTKSKTPIVSLLCSEEKMARKVTEIVKNDAYVNVHNMAYPKENILNDVMYSDVIIIYTTALKIAPKPIYDLCVSLKQYGKNYYVLLGGWNLLPKHEEMVKDKSNRVLKDYDFIDPLMVHAIFKSEADYFITFEEGLEKILDHVKNNFKVYRNQQEEILYQYIEKEMKKEFRLVKNNIQGEYQHITELHDFVYKKAQGAEITFKNANVDLRDITMKLEKDLSQAIQINIQNIINDANEEDDDAELNESKIRRIESKIKNHLNDSVDAFFKDYHDTESKEKVKIESDIKKIQGDMTFVVKELNKDSSIDQNLYDELKKALSDVSSLDKITTLQETEFARSLKYIQKQCKYEINEFNIDFKAFNFIKSTKKVVNTTENFVRNLVENKLGIKNPGIEEMPSNTDQAKNDHKSSEENQVETSQNEETNPTEDTNDSSVLIDQLEQLNYKNLLNSVDEALDTLKNKLLVMIEKALIDCENEIKNKSKYYVHLYFSGIRQHLELIQGDVKGKIAKL
jgi:hypothetical protein